MMKNRSGTIRGDPSFVGMNLTGYEDADGAGLGYTNSTAGHSAG